MSPVEIEEALSRHPAVAECLATGEPDPDLGQKVKVYVTLAPGYAPSPALREALMAFHNEACAGFKRSGTWPSSPPWPTTPTES